MKKTILKLGIVTVMIIILSSSGCGNDSNLSGTSCQETHTDIYDFVIGTVALRYDITGVDGMVKYKLNLYHQHNFVNDIGEIRSLDYIITRESYTSHFTASNKASLKINQTGTDCTGAISKTIIDPSRIAGGRIKDVTNMGVFLKELKLELKTITCTDVWPNISLMWSEMLRSNQNGFDDSYIASAYRSTSFIKSESDGTFVRPSLPTVKSNSSSYVVVGGSTDAIPDYINENDLKSIDFSGTHLNNQIYMGSEINKNVVWDAPLIYNK